MPNLPPKPDDIPMSAHEAYADEGWVNVGDWLGTGNIAYYNREYWSFETARAFVQGLKLKNVEEWHLYCKGEMPNLPPKPEEIPNDPNHVYREKGFQGYGDWLGTGTIATWQIQYRPFEDARAFAQSLNLKNRKDWRLYCKGEMPHLESLPEDIPRNPHQTYRDKGWKGIGDWLGTAKQRGSN